MRVILTRTMTAYRTPEHENMKGERGTHALALHLTQAGHDVTYYGKMIGTPPDGVHVVDPWGGERVITKDNYDSLTADELTKRLRDVAVAGSLAQRAGEHHVIVCVLGSCTTRCLPSDEAQPQMCSMIYSLPAVWLAHESGIPTIDVITDVRSYPTEVELHGSLRGAAPVAVLSQERAATRPTRRGVPGVLRAVRSGAEFWPAKALESVEPPDLAEEPDLLVSTAAHSHVHEPKFEGSAHDGGRRLAAWRDVLVPWLSSSARARRLTRVCGTGWELMAREYPDVFMGTVPTIRDAMRLMSRGLGGPVMPQRRRSLDVLTTKPRYHAMSGSVPMLRGRGGPWTYDRDGEILPLDHPCRIGDDGGIDAVIAGLRRSKTMRSDVVAEVLARTTPDFSVLERVMTEVRGLSADEARSRLMTREGWGDEYGGLVLPHHPAWRAWQRDDDDNQKRR